MSPRNARSDRRPSRPSAVRNASRYSRRSVEQRLGSSGSSGYRSARGYRSASRGANQTSPGQYSRNNPNYSHASAKRRAGRGKKIAFIALAVVLVAVVGAGTAFAVYLGNINAKLTNGGKSAEEINAINDVLAPKKNFNEPFYMMLIGSDRREGDTSMGARSDTNIVVRVDPVKNQATMLSIPRDTMVDIDGYGINKFNATYNYGGAAAVIQESSQLLGVDISCYAEVNFEELVALVDVVGGVDVEVDERIDDTDADGSTGIPGAERIIIEEGLQHLDGDAALVFARSRAFLDGDFTRTANQRKLIAALVDKVLSLPVTELPGVVEAAADCVTTNLSVTDIISLAQQFKDGEELTVYSAMVPTAFVPELIDGISYVVTDTETLSEMMQVVEAGEDPSGIEGNPNCYPEELAKFGYGSGTGSYSGYSSGYGYDPYAGGTSGSSSGSSGYYDNSGYYDPGYGTGSGTAGADYGYGGYDAGGYDATGGYGEAAYGYDATGAAGYAAA